MTALSVQQIRWLRALALAGRALPMSATEIGDPHAAELAELGFATIITEGRAFVWEITPAGSAWLEHHRQQPSPEREIA